MKKKKSNAEKTNEFKLNNAGYYDEKNTKGILRNVSDDVIKHKILSFLTINEQSKTAPISSFFNLCWEERKKTIIDYKFPSKKIDLSNQFNQFKYDYFNGIVQHESGLFIATQEGLYLYRENEINLIEKGCIIYISLVENNEALYVVRDQKNLKFKKIYILKHNEIEIKNFDISLDFDSNNTIFHPNVNQLTDGRLIINFIYCTNYETHEKSCEIHIVDPKNNTHFHLTTVDLGFCRNGYGQIVALKNDNKVLFPTPAGIEVWSIEGKSFKKDEQIIPFKRVGHINESNDGTLICGIDTKILLYKKEKGGEYVNTTCIEIEAENIKKDKNYSHSTKNYIDFLQTIYSPENNTYYILVGTLDCTCYLYNEKGEKLNDLGLNARIIVLSDGKSMIGERIVENESSKNEYKWTYYQFQTVEEIEKEQKKNENTTKNTCSIM